MEGSSSAAAEVSRQIRVRFITGLPKHLRVSSSSMAIPSDINRFGLSEIINALLHQDTPIAFDFLIGGQLVRVPLEKFLLENGISVEKVLDYNTYMLQHLKSNRIHVYMMIGSVPLMVRILGQREHELRSLYVQP